MGNDRCVFCGAEILTPREDRIVMTIPPVCIRCELERPQDITEEDVVDRIYARGGE